MGGLPDGSSPTACLSIADAETFRDVENVEGLSNQICPVAVPIGEGAVKMEIERVKAVVETSVIADLKEWGCL